MTQVKTLIPPERAKELEQESIRACVGSSQYISAVTEVQKGQVGVEGVARHVSGTLEKVSTHYPAPFRQRVVEVILVILVAALILLICDSMSLNWLLCYEKAKKHIVI